jgi:hypothetical protein
MHVDIYIVSTRYRAINEGQNKLTAILSCLKATSSNTNLTPNNLIKWYGVNVTGVSTSTLTSPTVKGNNSARYVLSENRKKWKEVSIPGF